MLPAQLSAWCPSCPGIFAWACISCSSSFIFGLRGTGMLIIAHARTIMVAVGKLREMGAGLAREEGEKERGREIESLQQHPSMHVLLL